MIKVASYCRVSTDREDQLNSFESQQRYFREYIDRHPEWELYDVYADEGISGTSTEKRVQFNRMIHDAYRGKFSMIITKEVSRFSRNLLDTIAYTRELKAQGVGIVFMNDGFCSLDPDAELRLSIMGSIAQEESRKISSRVKWGQMRRMEQGIVFGTSLLGYDVCNGKLSVNPEGAEVVRLIFQKYGVEKKGTSVIARELREAGFKTRSGNPIWNNSHIIKILRNEKYVGDLVQKKTITPDYLSHAKIYNKGQEKLIEIKNHHEPIISRDLWNIVQDEIKKRNRHNHQPSEHGNRYIFSGKITCGECGSRYVSRRKIRKNGTSYMRWCCYTATTQGTKKIDIHGNHTGCNIGKVVRDDLLVQTLTRVIKSLQIDVNWVIQNLANIINAAMNTDDLTKSITQKLRHQIQQITKKKAGAIDAFLSGAITQAELEHMKALYDDSLADLNKRMQMYKTDQDNRAFQSETDIKNQIREIILCERVSEPFYKMLLEKVTIHRDGRFQISINKIPQIWYFELRYHKTSNGCHDVASVPTSVSRPFNSSKGML